MEMRVTLDDARIRRALSSPELVQGPIARMLKRSALTVQARAMMKSPVDTGRLRSSITSSIRPLEARISTPVFYAPFVEAGTRPHMPPTNALQPWARRHGLPVFALAMAIAKRGTRRHPFMGPALKESVPDIKGFIDHAAREIERKWSGG